MKSLKNTIKIHNNVFCNKKNKKPPILFLLGRQIFRTIFSLFYRWQIDGIENIPKSGGAIIAPNHISFFDPPLIGASIYRPLYFMAKKALFDIPILRYIIKRTNAFPIEQFKNNIKTIRYAFSLLQQGNLLLIFPEGTRRKTETKDKKIEKVNPGIGMLACRACVPLIPTKIENIDMMLKFKQIKLKYGKPIYPPKKFTKKDYICLSQKVLNIISIM
ncbi:MAG: 1-acyl-sn-glycerol-3-phosphate acyltransferase [Endomicrobium sp.]|jgi:1-acyl-sn-glycerol-3-phosphate acyltransferase|nr:1-acyl-sn-glycerol-3-phosphate acyltransferase [Endomicrobium sp.]